MKNYFVRTIFKLFSIATLFLALSCDKEEAKPITNSYNGNNNNGSTATAPAFDASVPSTSEGITAASFKISSTLKDNGGSAITQHGHVWSDNKTEPTISDSKSELGATSGPFPLKFASELKSLNANTSYNVRAYATNDKGITYGAAEKMKTNLEELKIPKLAAGIPSNITNNSLKFNATIETKPNRKITKYGFIYSDKELTGTNSTFEIKKDAGTNLPENTNFPFNYSLEVSGLQANTLYHVKAFVELEVETSPTQKFSTFVELGNAVTFRTTGEVSNYGKWNDITATFTKSSLDLFDFWHNGSFYTFSRFGGEISTYIPSTNQFTRNSGQKFQGKGSIQTVNLIDNDKVFMVMGYSSSSDISNETWIYDLKQKVWSKKADFPGIPRTDFVVLYVNKKLYVGGGNEYTLGRPGFATTLKDWWEYDPAADKWTKKEDMLIPAYDLQGFETHIGLAVVGLGQSFSTSSVANSWYSYNPFKNEWRKLSSISGDFQKSGGVVWKERFSTLNYAILKNTNGTKYFLWEFSPITEKWIKQTELPAETSFNTFVFPNNYNNKPTLIHYNSNVGFSSLKVFEFTKN